MGIAVAGVPAVFRKPGEVEGGQRRGRALAFEEVGEVADDAACFAARAGGEGDVDDGEILFQESGIGFESVLHHPLDVIAGEHEDKFPQGGAFENQVLLVRGGPSWARTRDLSLIRTAL